MNNPDKLEWFYNLPKDEESIYLKNPSLFKGDFLIKVKLTVIGNESYYLVEHQGKDWLLGLIFFFKCFTEIFENKDYGNPGSENPFPFVIAFNSGLEYKCFKDVLEKHNLKIRYIPAVAIIRKGKFDIWFFI